MDAIDKIYAAQTLLNEVDDLLTVAAEKLVVGQKPTTNTGSPKLLDELEAIAKEEESVMNSYSFRRSQRLYAVIAQLRAGA